MGQSKREQTQRSKFLSLVLRHHPDRIGIELDEAGWVSIESLLRQLDRHGNRISRETLVEIVTQSPKQRFAISEDGLRIRANQGHSVEVELGHPTRQPPELLYHGTVRESVAAIREQGLSRMKRHKVHLSPDTATARMVAQRRGKAIVLVVRAREMAAAGHEFQLSDNGVWLTDAVDPNFIDFPESG